MIRVRTVGEKVDFPHFLPIFPSTCRSPLVVVPQVFTYPGQVRLGDRKR